MSVHTAAAWAYRGVWGILARWFKVPSDPPTLPFHDSAAVESFRPADAFLRYLLLQFWIVTLVVAAPMAAVWIVCLVAAPIVAAVLALPMLTLLLAPALARYVAIHLRFDTTWYVLTDRSLRIRRGIWTIRETTITFENIQNVTVNQGPLQRLFGISNVIVQTAGGSAHGPKGEEIIGPHAGVLEGLADAARIRDLVLSRLTQSRTAGLGDEPHAADPAARPGAAARDGRTGGWTSEHLAVLREIRDRAQDLAAG